MSLLLARIFLLSSSLSSAVSVIYKGTGDEVVISSGSDHGRITTITWKHNDDIAVEWYGGEPTAYRHFIGSTSLDIWTGALTILGLTRDHSGFYTAEINNRVIDTTEVQVISPVPKPTVSKQCDAKMTYCTLTCEGHTTDFEPVTYSWEIFDVLNYYKGQQINLTKENHDPWYRCKMRNPISSETSEEFPNPFLNPLLSRNLTIIIILVLFFLFLLLSGLIAGIVIRRRCNSSQRSYSPMKVFSSKTAASNDQTGEEGKETDEENTELREVSCNRVAPSLSVEETSAQTSPTSSVVPDTNTQTEMLDTCEASIPDKTSNQPDGEPATTTSESQEALTSAAETSNKSGNSPDQVQTNGEIPRSSALTENSQKKEEKFEVQDHKSETSESNNQTENSPKKEEVKVQIHNSEPPESNNQTEESAEESNEDETTRLLLQERNQIISVSG